MAPNIDALANCFNCALLLLILTCYYVPFAHSTKDTILAGEELVASDTIISSNGYFELGFFHLVENSTHLYLGIRFTKVSSKTIIWVANRDFPLKTSFVNLTISDNGNLVIMEGNTSSYMVTNVSSSNDNISATLLDSGNFVLRNENILLWQSFDYPTDNWLNGMKLGYDKTIGKTWSITSWRSNGNPSDGDFTLAHDVDGSEWSFVMKKKIEKYWSYWINAKGNSNWTMEIGSNKLYYTFIKSYPNISYVVFNVHDKGFLFRYFINSFGELGTYFWLENNNDWNLSWSMSSSQCGFYAYCGSFGICSQQLHASCSCLPGFVPNFESNWKIKNYDEGCVRKTILQCDNSNVSRNRFIMLSNVALPDNELALYGIKGNEDCKLACLSNCSCNAYSYHDNLCFVWMGDLVNVQQLSDTDISGKKLYIKVDASELSKATHKKKKLSIIFAITISLLLIISSIFVFWMWTKRSRSEGMDLLLFDFSSSLGSFENHLARQENHEKEIKQVDIPVFSYASVCAATNNFSDENKLGEGGFGPVYKGKLINSYEVAVKRLSRGSRQGCEEFKNEAWLIAKLQHKNLVKLLGYCTKEDEHILIYEYLSNKSLDIFLFGSFEHNPLDWRTRIQIIEGIAQGLLYLHQYSRLKIIHRDLKASNILLDKDMNPKISDFGTARIVCGKETQATNRIVGTFGYMPPEYALDGTFSIKSDVFSFGVLCLEILSGKKNTSVHHGNNSVNLVGHTWNLWNSNRPLDMLDPILGSTCSLQNALRYINIALLCVEENALDRPTMPYVVSLLRNEISLLPSPQKPFFPNTSSILDLNSSEENGEDFSVNKMTISIMEAR